MDGLSGASSVIAVVSLAVQLVDSTNKLREAFASFRSASADIRALDDRLKLLTDILQPLISENDLSITDAALSSAVDRCRASIMDVESMVQAKLPGFGSTSSATRTWTSVKVLWDGRRLRKLTNGLADATEDLELALSASHRRQGADILSGVNGLRTHVTNQSQVILDAIDSKTTDVKQKLILLHDKTSLSYQQSLMQMQAGQVAHMRDSMAANASGFASVETAMSNLATNFQQKLTVESDMIQSRQEDIKRDLHTQMNTVIASAMPMFAAQASKQMSSVVEQLIDTHVVKLHCPHASARAKSADVVRGTALSPGDSACSSTVRKRRRFLTSTRTCHRTRFGRITIVSRHMKQQMTLAAEGDDTVVIEDDLYESSIKIVPSEWLRWLGLRYVLEIWVNQQNRQLPQVMLSPQRLVPCGAPILRLCMIGDIVGVQQLLSKGLASIHDVNEFGSGPLWYAVSGCHPQLCAMLLDAGIDVMTGSSMGSYLSIAMDESEYSPTSDVHETMGVLLRFYGGIAAVPENETFLLVAFSKSSLIEWVWQQSLLDRDISSLEDRVKSLGQVIFLSDVNEDIARQMMAEVDEEWLQTVFMEAFTHGMTFTSLYFWRLHNLKALQERIGSLHFKLEANGSTPLQIAMEDRLSIRNFSDSLLEAAIETSVFFSAGLLGLDAGWTKASVASLLGYIRCAVTQDHGEATIRFCYLCGRVADMAYPHWREDIKRIRQGLDPDGPFTTAETEARTTRAAEVQEEFVSMLEYDLGRYECQLCWKRRQERWRTQELDYVEDLEGESVSDELEPSPGLLDVDF